MKIGGYAYKGGRVILENFTDNLTEMINEKKSAIKKCHATTHWLFLK